MQCSRYNVSVTVNKSILSCFLITCYTFIIPVRVRSWVGLRPVDSNLLKWPAVDFYLLLEPVPVSLPMPANAHIVNWSFPCPPKIRPLQRSPWINLRTWTWWSRFLRTKCPSCKFDRANQGCQTSEWIRKCTLLVKSRHQIRTQVTAVSVWCSFSAAVSGLHVIGVTVGPWRKLDMFRCFNIVISSWCQIVCSDYTLVHFWPWLAWKKY